MDLTGGKEEDVGENYIMRRYEVITAVKKSTVVLKPEDGGDTFPHERVVISYMITQRQSRLIILIQLCTVLNKCPCSC